MPDEQIVPATPGALERPSFVPAGATAGTDHIGKDDVQLPRLGLAQQMSPELVEGNAAHIPGLKIQDLFDNLSRRIYGRGPLQFVVVRADPPRWIEFNPREAGGGIKRFNVPHDDPATQFDPVTGAPPKATKFYDFVIFLLPEWRPIALSLKMSGLTTARALNGLIKMKQAPVYAGKYELGTAMKTNTKGTFAVYTVKDLGWVDEAMYHAGEKAFNSFKDKDLKIDREPGDEDFPTDEV